MIIGFDAKRAVRNNTGLGNYSRLVIDALAERYPMDSLRLYTPVMKDNPRLAPVTARANVTLVGPDSRRWKLAPPIWRSLGVTSQAEEDGCALFHGLAGELPFNIEGSAMASVVTIHDLIFRHYPEYYAAVDRKIYDYKARCACSDATRVIAISECTKRDIMTAYGTPSDKIDVIYQGCHEIFSEPISEATLAEVRHAYNLPARYIVTVGTVESRKNQMLAVKALSLLPKDVELLIVGGETPYADTLRQAADTYGVSSRIRRLSGIPFAHLPALFAMAAVSSYTSRFEGFGLPVIESINSGTPVIACTGSVLEEAGGPGAVYVDPDDVDGYAAEAIKLLNDVDLRADMVARGREYTSRFGHDAMAEAIMATYRRALDTRAKRNF